MKKLILVITFLLFSSTAHATLIDNLDGTITQIRNDGSRLMWLKDANLAATNTFGVSGISGGKMDWNTLTGTGGWLEAMNASNYLGYSDWRLPETLPINGISYDINSAYDGSTDKAYNISAPGSAFPGSTGSEMAYMFYVELGNLGYFDVNGVSRHTGWGLINTGLFTFTNLQQNPFDIAYWSGTKYTTHTGLGWDFDFSYGFQDGYDKSLEIYAWTVRDVTAPIPEPATIALLGIGLAGLAGAEARRRRKKKA